MFPNPVWDELKTNFLNSIAFLGSRTSDVQILLGLTYHDGSEIVIYGNEINPFHVIPKSCLESDTTINPGDRYIYLHDAGKTKKLLDNLATTAWLKRFFDDPNGFLQVMAKKYAINIEQLNGEYVLSVCCSRENFPDALMRLASFIFLVDNYFTWICWKL